MNFRENFQSNTAPFLLIQLSFLHRALPLLFNPLLLTFTMAVPHSLAGVQVARFQQLVKYFAVTVSFTPCLFKVSDLVLWNKVYPVVWSKSWDVVTCIFGLSWLNCLRS